MADDSANSSGPFLGPRGLSDTNRSLIEIAGRLGGVIGLAEKLAGLIAKPFEDAAKAAVAMEEITGRQAETTLRLIALHQTDEQQLETLRKAQDRSYRRLSDLKKLEDRTETRWAEGGEGQQPISWTVKVGLTDGEKAEQMKLGGEVTDRGFEIDRLARSIKEKADAARERQAAMARAAEGERAAQERAAAEQKKIAAEQVAAQKREAEAQQKQSEARQAETARAGQLKQDNLEVSKAIDKAKNDMAGYDQQIAMDDKNPALTDEEKYQKRVENLDKQTAALERLTVALKGYKSAQAELDKPNQDALNATIKSFEDKKKKNAVDRQPPSTRTQTNDKALRDLNDPAKHYQSAGEGLAGGFASWVADMGTIGDQMAASIKNTLGSAVKGITSEILKWDGSGKGALRAIGNIGQMIFRGMIEQIVQMAVQWGVTQLLIKTGLISTHVLGETLKGEEAASTVAKEGIKTPILATNAGLASVSSFGVAAILGIALLIAGIAALAFDTGGYTPGGERQKPVGVVHAGEWVAPQWLVNHPVYGPQIALLEGARTGARGYDFGGLVNDLAFAPAAAMTRPGYASAGRGDGGEGIAGNGAGHRPVNVYPLMADDRGSIERAQRDPYSDARFVHMLKKHRRVLGVKS